MRYKNNLLDKFGLQSDPMLKKRVQAEPMVNHLASPTYLRQSSGLIKDALQNGFDVLQLANGDIVTTGTRVIVNKYAWDATRNKLVKVKAAPAKAENEDKPAKSAGKKSVKTPEKVSEEVTEDA